MVFGKNEVIALIGEFMTERGAEQGAEISRGGEQYDLFENGDLDSFGFVELISFLTGRTGQAIDLSEVDLAALTRVGAIATYFSTQGGHES